MNTEQTHLHAARTRLWRILTVALGFAMLGLAAFSLPATISSPSFAQDAAATYEEEIQSGRDLLRRRRYEDALKSFRRANDLKGKTSAESFFLMAQAYLGLDAHKNVIQSSDKAIEFAGNDTRLQADAYNLKGVALQALANTKDQKKLQEAEVAFRAGLALNAEVPILHYNLGYTMMQLSRDPEGIAELKKYIELRPGDTKAEGARKLIDNPRRAREPFAPDFSFTTSEGEYISLEDLKGKVVLLDFWGTWCPPCVESVPALRNLNQKFTKKGPFVMIGVSTDSDEHVWRAFTAKEKMVWPQFLDRDRQVSQAFGVRSFPTYIVLDHEGIIRFRTTGASFEREAALQEAINKYVKLVTKPPSD